MFPRSSDFSRKPSSAPLPRATGRRREIASPGNPQSETLGISRDDRAVLPAGWSEDLGIARPADPLRELLGAIPGNPGDAERIWKI